MSEDEVKGYVFNDRNLGPLLYVKEGEFKGWLCSRHPDGKWVTIRKATPEDLLVLGAIGAFD